MCDPVTAAIVVGGTSAIAGAAGGYAGDIATAKTYEFQSEQALSNAAAADVQAEDVLTLGKREEARAELRGESLIGAQKAAFAATGISVESGSAKEVFEGTAVATIAEAETIHESSLRAAWGFRSEAAGFRKEAQLAKFAAKSTKKLAGLKAFTTLLSGASTTGASASLIA